MMKRLAFCVAVVVGSLAFLAPSYAQDEVAPIAPDAWGTVQGVIACDFGEDGLTVLSADFAPGKLSGFNPQPGDSCLDALLQIPPAYILRPPEWVNPRADTVESPKDLVWVIVKEGRISAIVDCAPGEGGLTTRVVDTGILSPSPYVEMPCVSALAAFQAMGGRAVGPTAAALSIDGDGVGNLVWFNESKGFGFITQDSGELPAIQVVGCGLNDQGLLVAKYHEISGIGVLPVNDQSCVATLFTVPGMGKLVLRNQPVAVSKAKKGGIDTSDPGCLIWDLVGGTIGQ